MGIFYTILFAFLNVLRRPIYNGNPMRIELAMVDLLFGSRAGQGFMTKPSEKGSKSRPKKILIVVPKRY